MQAALATAANTLEHKIKARTACVGIVGLGYVGLPLAVEFTKAGFSVTGIDVQEEKVASLKRSHSYVQDVPSAILRPLVEERRFRATTDFSVVENLDTINIAVPTPLRKTKDPDMSYVVSACQEVAKHLLVILESTTYPGTRPTNWFYQCSRERVYESARISFCASRPSESTPGIVHITLPIFQK